MATLGGFFDAAAWRRNAGWGDRAHESLARGRIRRGGKLAIRKVRSDSGAAEWMHRLGPWKLTLLSALICGMCFEPVGLGPVMLFAIAPWLAMLPRFRSMAGAMSAGFLFGWVYLLIPLYWLVFMSPLNAPDPPIATMIVMWMLSCGLQALWFAGVAAVGASLGAAWPRLTWLVLLPLAWAGMETGRLTWPFPGPLINAGESLHQLTVVIQAADIGGVYLISAFVILINGCFSLQLDRRMRGLSGAGSGRGLATWVMLGAFVAILGYGGWRSATLSSELKTEGPLVVLIQPNVGQEQKNREYAGQGTSPGARERQSADSEIRWNEPGQWESIDGQFPRLEAMTLDAARRYPDADLFVWPETAMPGVMPPDTATAAGAANNEWLMRHQPMALTRTRLMKPLLYGVEVAPSAAELERHPYLSELERKRVIYNSAVLLDPLGTPQARHDKRKLVPAGEFIPFRGTWIGDFAAHYMQTLAGYVPRLLPGDGGGAASALTLRPATDPAARPWSFSTNICYEYAFPDLYQDLHRGRPVDFAVTLSNEAWYGRHAELDQAVVQTKFRAIESRASFARCTNSGVTCVIDPLGREVSRLRGGAAGTDRLIADTHASRLPVFGEAKATVWQSGFGAGFLAFLRLVGVAVALVGVWSAFGACARGVRRIRRRLARRRAVGGSA